MMQSTKLTLTKLCMSADYYTTLSPAFACFAMNQANIMKSDADLPSTESKFSCKLCGSVFRPDNHSTRFRRQMALSKKIRQLRRRASDASRAHRLGKFQRHLLDLYENRMNQQIITCSICQHRTKFPIPARERKITKSTPTSPALSKRQLKRRQAKRKSEADPDLLGIASRKSSGTGSGPRPREGNETVEAESAVYMATVQGSTAVQASPVDSGPRADTTRMDRSIVKSRGALPFTTPKTSTVNKSWLLGLRKSSNKKKTKQAHGSLQMMLAQSNESKHGDKGSGLTDFLAGVN